MKAKLHLCYICRSWGQGRELGLAHANSLVGGSVSSSPQRCRLLDSLGLPVESLTSSGPPILPPNSSSRLPELCLIFCCGSLDPCICFRELQGGASQRTVTPETPVCNRKKVSSVVSGIGSCPWDGKMGWVSVWASH